MFILYTPLVVDICSDIFMPSCLAHLPIHWLRYFILIEINGDAELSSNGRWTLWHTSLYIPARRPQKIFNFVVENSRNHESSYRRRLRYFITANSRYRYNLWNASFTNVRVQRFRGENRWNHEEWTAIELPWRRSDTDERKRNAGNQLFSCCPYLSPVCEKRWSRDLGCSPAVHLSIVAEKGGTTRM